MRKIRPIPHEDEVTKYGVTIYWSQIKVIPKKDNPRHNGRVVPTKCACGLHRDIYTPDLFRTACRGLCMSCAMHARARRGKHHPDWNGGKHVNQDGYSQVNRSLLTDRENALFREMMPSRHYIPEHRLVMARHLGRPLSRDEHVHHISGDKLDNRIENLRLVSPSQHASVELVKAREELRRLRKILDEHNLKY